MSDSITNPGQAILMQRAQIYIQNKRAEFEENKEKFKVAAEEAIFKKLPEERQQELIKKGYFDEDGERISTKTYYYHSDLHDIEFHYEDLPSYGRCAIGTRSKAGDSDWDWRVTYSKRPLVKTLWNQRGTDSDGNETYNKYTPAICEGSNASVGCIAVAMAQVMAYHKKPSYVRGRYMNWNDMTRVRSGQMFTNYKLYSEK